MNRDSAGQEPSAGSPRVPDPDDAPVPTLLAAAWEQAEAQLYPAVLERPDLYRRSIRLVRATADALRRLGPGTSALLAAGERGPELVATVADEHRLSVVELDLQMVARAALALRYRELRAEQTLRRRRRRLEQARAAGDAWVVVEETGDPAGDPFLPYVRLEVATATGRGLLASTAPDEEYRRVEHRLRRVRLVLETGEVVDDDDPQAGSFPDAAARDAAAAAIRTGDDRSS